MTGLSFPVIFGVLVLIFHAVLLPSVLPAVTPDFDVDLADGDEPSETLEYEILPSRDSRRYRRQVQLPTDDDQAIAPPDKSALNKQGQSSATKKPITEGKSFPTLQTAEISSTNAIGLSQSLPTDPPTPRPQQGVVNNNGATSDVHPDDLFSNEDLLFDGNSSYLNNTYYDQQPKQHNVTLTKLGHYRYYTAHYAQDGAHKYWIDMSTHDKAKTHEMLSNAHRRAATVKPNFNILFYGHAVPNLTVATGGFIYLGEQVHAWLAATQYVAPLMANFDSSTSSNATVNYINDDDFFTVEWNQVRLQDSPQVGPFTFQATLCKNGTIMFVYKTIPIPVNKINDTNHPVKVGLSDAYIKDKTMLFVRQKTIYEYDRVDLKQVNITNGTVIIFTKLPTCNELTSCEECTGADITFKCAWCPATKSCSNGTDRNFQQWTQAGCDKINGNVTEESQCSSAKDAPSAHKLPFDPEHDDEHDHEIHGDRYSDSSVKKVKASESEGMSATGVIGVMFLMMLVFGAIGWLAYAYFFPHSPSGQVLIRYRPSQWGFRRGEARYTAASIHM